MQCPECKSENIRKKGIVINRYGKVQNYQCKDCGRYFIERKKEA